MGNGPIDAQHPFYGFLSKSLKGKDLQVFQLAGDASARRYFRIHTDDKSYVLMVWDPFEDEKNYPFLNVLRHFAKNKVHVPNVISVSKSEGLVLLEDLGDLTLERKYWENQSPEHVLPYYRQAIDELVKIHFDCTNDKSEQWVDFKIEFNTARLLWEMNYAKEHLLEKFFGIKFSDSEAKALEADFTSICETLHKEPKHIAHRDYHSRNLMIKVGTMRVIDFQDARLGPIQYDLVSLLRDSYVALDDTTGNLLIDYYLALRRQKGFPAIDREHFEKIYELQTVQRCLKACGSFASFYNTRSDTRYLKYIPNTLKRVKQSLQLFPEFKSFASIMDSNQVFDRELPHK